MKRYYIPFFIGLIILFSSCSPEPLTYSHYYKSFFLGDTSFLMDGEIFDFVDYPNEIKPWKINSFVVKTSAVDGWEIIGTIKSESKYELTMDIIAGNTINKETINPYNYFPYNKIFPDDFPICSIDFYINSGLYIGSPIPAYRQPRNWDPQKYYKYDYLEYKYVYVAETFIISETYTNEGDFLGIDTINIYHFDLDFSKPGWYKIITYDHNYNNNKFKNDTKHGTGKNTNFYEYFER